MTRQVKNKRDSNGVLNVRLGTVYDVNIKYTAPDGIKVLCEKGFATKKEVMQIASIASQRKQTIANYVNLYIGGVAINQLLPAMVDKIFQQIIDKGLKPSTAAGAKRVLSVALSHARKYRYIETNAAKEALTKFGNDRRCLSVL